MPIRRLIPFLAVPLLMLTLTYYWRHKARKIFNMPKESAEASDVTKVERNLSQEDISRFCNLPYKTICSQAGVVSDPTGEVKKDVTGEVKALRIFEEIVREHPDWKRDQIDEALAARIYTPKRLERIKNAEQWVKKTLIQILNKQPNYIFSDSDKKLLIDRLHRIELELPPPASLYADERELLTKNDVFFESSSGGKIKMRVGGAYILAVKSFFNMVFTIAHEFGHSLDPCELKKNNIQIPIYETIEQCFVQQGWVQVRPDRVYCGKFDQTSEVFADWIAVQVTSIALKTLTVDYSQQAKSHALVNSVKDLCEQDEDEDELNLETHPHPKIRIKKIFFGNPKIREILSCRPSSFKSQYCGLDFILK